MQLTQNNIDFIFYGYDVKWQAAYLNAPIYYDKFASVLPSSAREERYMWLDRVPQMREWLGERQVVNVSTRSYVLVNRDWELTLELDRNVILDDQVGVFNPSVDMMGLEAKLWPDQLFLDTLQLGHDGAALHLCHDGQSFFSTSHPIQIDNAASSTQSNYFTTTALTAANFNTIRYTMIGYQANDTRPIGVMPDLLLIPPGLEATARQILNTSFIAPAATLGMNSSGVVQSNPLVGMADILVHPYLANQQTVYYMLQTKGTPVKPFIFQLRQAPVFVYKNRPDDDNLFLRKKFLFGVDSRGSAGYSLYFYAAKGVA